MKSAPPGFSRRGCQTAASRATALRAGRVCGFALGLALASGPLRAEDGTSPVIAVTGALVGPPPSMKSTLQYGVALTAETVASPGPVCGDSRNPCILGSGGGIAMRIGWRPNEHFYVGGAYAMSKQEPHQLYRVAILQQARVEARWYFPTEREATPLLLLGAGFGGYGNEWSIDTCGPNATLGAGIEVQLGGPVLVLSLGYQPMYFRAWTDSSTLSHDAGIAHLIGVELAIEAQGTVQAAP